MKRIEQRGYINWKLLVVLILGVVVLAGTALVLPKYQQRVRSENALVDGLKAYEAGEYEQAAVYLGRYIARHQDDLDALIKYADSQVKRRPRKVSNIQQALGSYRMVLRTNPTLIDAAKPLAELYIGAGSPAESKLIAERFLEKSDNPDMRRLLATAESSLGNTDLAIEQLTQLLEKFPDHELGYETLGLLYEAKKKDVTSARYWCEQAVENNPESLQAKIILVGFYLRHNQREQAEPLMPTVDELAGQPPKLTLRVVQLWLEMGQRETAEAGLAAIAPHVKDLTRYWEIKGRLALVDRDAERMLAIAKDSRDALGERYWEFMPQAMELFMNAGALDEVQACINEMNEREYAPAISSFFQGWIAFAKEDFQGAVGLWKTAAGQGYRTTQARLMLAGAYRRLNNPGAARQVLQRLVADLVANSGMAGLNVNDLVRSRLALAEQLNSMDLWRAAQDEAVAVLKLDPDNVAARMIYTRAAMQITQPESWDSVEDQLQRLSQQDPDNPEVVWLQYESALRQKDVGTAAEILNRLEGLDGVKPLRLGLARANLAMIQEHWQDALAVLAQLQDEYPDSIDVVLRLAAIHLQQEDRAACEQVFKDALGRVSLADVLQALGMQLAQLYEQWDRLEEAKTLMADLDKRLGNSITIKRRRLSLLQSAEIVSEGQVLVDEIKAAEGEQGWQWKLEQARLWYLSDSFEVNYPRLVALMKENLAANPDDMDSRRILALAYEKAGQLRLALATYREAVDRNPTNLSVLIPYISALYRAQELNEANRMMAMIKDLGLESPQLQPLEVQGYLSQGKVQNATQVLQEMYEQHPEDIQIGISLAMLSMNEQKYDEGAQILDQLAQFDPNSLPVVTARVQLDMVQGKVESALARSKQFIERVPTASSYLLRGRILADAGRLEEADADYQHALELEPDSPNVWYAVYQYHRSTEQRDKVLEDVDRLLVLDPTNVEYLREAIGQYLNSGIEERVQQGQALLTTSLEAYPSEEDLVLIKVQLLTAEGTKPAMDEALRRAQKVLSNNPSSELAWVLTARIYLRLGSTDEARDTILNGLSQVPGSQTLLMLKADAEALRSPTLASQTLKEILDNNPDNVDVLIKLVNVQVDAGRYRDALALIDEYLPQAEGTNRVALQMTRARALYQTEQKQEALAILKDLMAQTPALASVLGLTTQLLADDGRFAQAGDILKQWDEMHGQDVGVTTSIAGIFYRTQKAEGIRLAEDLLREQLKMHPDHIAALEAMGEILLATNDYQGAVTVYQKVLTLDPENVVSMNNLAWLLSSKLQRHQEALILVDRGLKMRPTYADMLDTRGGIYIALGQYERAIADLKKCIDLYPAGASQGVASRFLLGKAYAGANRKNEAIEMLNEALMLSGYVENSLSPEQRAEAQQLKNQLSTEP